MLLFPTLFLLVHFLKISSVDIECPPNYYRRNGIMYDIINFSQDCIIKDPFQTLYQKSFFISDKSCESDEKCLGTKSNPFDSFMKALIVLHDVDLAEQYLEQKVSFLLLGKRHWMDYYENKDIIFRFFRRFNASIEIRPFFCDEEEIDGCLMKDEIVDLMIKSDNFIFEVYRELNISNIRILGNDIVLNSDVTNKCWKSKVLCCEEHNFYNSTDSCYFLDKLFVIAEPNKKNTLFSMITIRSFFDYEKNIPTPKLNLNNFYLTNTYGLNNWASFILFNEMNYVINLEQCYFYNNAFGFGYFYQLKLIDDPYYQKFTLIPIFDKFFPNIFNVSSIYINNYNNFGVKENFVSGIFAMISLFTFSFESSLEYILKMANISIQNNDFSFLSAGKITFDFGKSSNINAIIDFRGLLFMNNTAMSLFNLNNQKMEVHDFLIINNTQFIIKIIDVRNQSYLSMNNGVISGSKYTNKIIFMACSLSFIILNNITFENIFDKFLIVEDQSILTINYSLIHKVNVSKNFIYFVDSKLYLDHIIFIDVLSLLESGYVFYFLSMNNVFGLYFTNSVCINIEAFTIFEFEAYKYFSSIYFTNLEFSSMKNVVKKANNYHYCFLADFGASVLNSLIMEKIFIRDSRALQLLYAGIGGFKIFINDITFRNFSLIQYYFIVIGYYKYFNGSLVVMNNLKFENLNFERKIAIFFLDYFEQIEFSNVFFSNLTCSQYLYSLVSTDMFVLEIYRIKFANLNSIFFKHNNFFCATVTIYMGDIYLMKFSNSEISSLLPSKNIRKFNAFVLYYFTYAIFENNTISGMSTKENPYYVREETGIISILGTNSYEPDTTYSNLYFKNNTIFDNFGYKYGSIGLVGITISVIINNTFINNAAKFGGTIVLFALNQSFIENNFFFESKATLGATIYIEKIINQIEFYNLTIRNSVSYTDAGVFLIKNANKTFFINISIFSTFSQKIGGVVFISETKYAFFKNISAFNLSAGEGGVFSIQNSYVEIFDSFFKKGESLTGGGFGVFSGSTHVLIETCELIDFYSKGNGGIIMSSSITYMGIISTIISNIKIAGDAFGIIYLEGFTEYKINSANSLGIFYLENVIFLQTEAVFGSCIYYSSNNILIVKNSLSLESRGSVFTFESDELGSITFDNFTINGSNYDVMDGHLVENSLVISITARITFINVFFKWNFCDRDMFKIMLSKISIINSTFTDFMKGDIQNSRSQRLIYGDLSIINLENNFIFNSGEDSSVYCMVFKLQSCNFSSFNDKFIDIEIKEDTIFHFEKSILSFTNTVFSRLYCNNNIFFIKSGIIAIESCNFNITLKKDTSKKEPMKEYLLYFDWGSLISQRILINNTILKISKLNGIFFFRSFSILIQSTNFISLSDDLSQALRIYSANESTIKNSNFENFFFLKGACIHVEKPEDEPQVMSVKILLCNFFGSKGFLAANIFVLGSVLFNMTECAFFQNAAIMSYREYKDFYYIDSGKAGCMLIDCEYYKNCFVFVDKTRFLYNFAENIGPTIISKSFNKFEVFNSVYHENYDQSNFSTNFISTPIMYYILSFKFKIDFIKNISGFNAEIKSIIIKNNFSLKQNFEIASGQEFNFSIMINDNFNHLLIKYAEITGHIDCIYEGNVTKYKANDVFIQDGSANSIEGILYFLNVKIFFFPKTKLSCNITLAYNQNLFFKSTFKGFTSNINKIVNRSLSIPQTIVVRNCNIGEIYLDDLSCFICNKGTYSLLDFSIQIAKKCKNCPANALCMGGKYISPLQGFWRYSNNSELILKCSSEQSCLGINGLKWDDLNEMQKIQGVCNKGYHGNICFYCDKGLARMKNNAPCESCEGMAVIYIKMFFSLFFIVIYISGQAKIFSNVESNDPNFAILVKLMLNHFQTISLINLIDLGWTVEFNFFFSVQDYLSCLTEDFFVIDCIINDIDQDLLVQKIIFTILLPIILSIFMVIIWVSAYLYFSRLTKGEKRTYIHEYLIEKMRITLLILLFILYPEIIRKCFSLMNCILIDDSNFTSVLSLSPNIECWSGIHAEWVSKVALPGLLVWGLLTPIVIFLIMFKNRKKIALIVKGSSSSSIKKEKALCEHINVDLKMDIELASLIFEDDLPEKIEIGYIRNKTTFIETIKIVLESKEILAREAEAILYEQPSPSSNNSRSSLSNYFLRFKEKNINSKSIISRVEDFRSFLRKANVKFKNITEEVFRKHLVLLQKTTDKKIFDLKLRKITIKDKNKKRSVDSEKIAIKEMVFMRNLGFIYRGYKKEYYFWEIIMFSRKFILILIGTFTEIFPKQIKPTLLIIFLIGYIYLQTSYSPYQSEFLNSLEIMSLITAFLTACIGILLFSEKLKEISYLFVFMVALINAFFFIVWIKKLFKYGKLKEKWQAFKLILIKWNFLYKRQPKKKEDKLKIHPEFIIEKNILK